MLKTYKYRLALDMLLFMVLIALGVGIVNEALKFAHWFWFHWRYPGL